MSDGRHPDPAPETHRFMWQIWGKNCPQSALPELVPLAEQGLGHSNFLQIRRNLHKMWPSQELSVTLLPPQIEWKTGKNLWEEEPVLERKIEIGHFIFLRIVLVLARKRAMYSYFPDWPLVLDHGLLDCPFDDSQMTTDSTLDRRTFMDWPRLDYLHNLRAFWVREYSPVLCCLFFPFSVFLFHW